MCLRFSKSNSIQVASEDDNRRNAEIDKMIRRDKKAQAKNVKILLLGEFQPCSLVPCTPLTHRQVPASPASRPF